MAQNWGSWTPWTPELTGSTTDPSMGTGVTQRGGYTMNGTIVHWWAQIAFGTSPSAGSGFYQLALPVTPIARDVPLGNGVAVDLSESGEINPLIPYLVPSFAAYLETDATCAFIAAASTPGPAASVFLSDTVPFAWAAGDLINLAGSYEAATS